MPLQRVGRCRREPTRSIATSPRPTRPSSGPSCAGPTLWSRITSSGRGWKLLGVLVETFAGIAVGLAVRRVVVAIGHELGGAARDAMRGQLAALATRATTRSPALPRPYELSPFLADASRRPLVDELGGRLQVRLCRDAAVSRALIYELHATLSHLVPDQISAFGALLERLEKDDAVELELADHLSCGWHQFCLALGTPACEPVTTSSRVRATWHLWRGHVVRTPRTTGRVVEEAIGAGFVLRIG